MTSSLAAGLVLGACWKDAEVLACLGRAGRSITGLAASAPAKPSGAKYPGIKITGLALTPKRAEVVDLSPCLGYVFQGMGAKITTSFAPWNDLLVPRSSKAILRKDGERYRNKVKFTEWSTSVILGVTMNDNLATINGCSASRNWKRVAGAGRTERGSA